MTQTSQLSHLASPSDLDSWAFDFDRRSQREVEAVAQSSTTLIPRFYRAGMVVQGTSRSIRLSNPVRTRPGPIS